MAPKEPSYFALIGVTEIKLNKIRDIKFHFPRAVTNYEDYQKLFEHSKENQIKGETSPIYLHNEMAPSQIYKCIPNVKLIVILRQPVERLYSRFLHLASEDRAPTPNFLDALDNNSIWWKRDDLVSEGFYYTNLKRYFDLFPAEHFKILFYEDFSTNPKHVMKEIYKFLNVSTHFEPDTSVTYNELGFVKNKYLDIIFGKNSPLKKNIEKIAPHFYDMMRQNNSIRKFVNKLRKFNLDKPPLDSDLKRKMTEILYKEEILKLQKLVGRDLSSWLQ